MTATVELRTITTVETAKEIRAALKQAFAGVKFSVTSSAGAVSVRWQDGPTVALVDRVVMPFQGKSFDGMDDSNVYRSVTLLSGERVNNYAFVFTGRSVSDTLRERVARFVSAHYEILNNGFDLETIVYQRLRVSMFSADGALVFVNVKP